MKRLHWLLWGIAALAVNGAAFPITILAFFNREAEESLGFQDYLIILNIVLICNMVIIQMLIALRRQNKQRFFSGLGVASLLVFSLVYFFITVTKIGVILILFSVAVSGIILASEVIPRNRGLN